jgi:spermidine/putrescine transport system permease protein
VSLAAQDRKRARGLLAPALLWTLAFFVVPFLAMLALSFAHMEGRKIVQGYDLGNYQRAFTDWSQLKALINSVEITLTVTVISVVLAWPLAAIWST